MKASKNLTSLNEFIDQEHGPAGSDASEEFEAGYEVFKLGAMLQQARQAKGLTQAQLAIQAPLISRYPAFPTSGR